MQLIDGRPVFAATDLVGFLACDHRLALEQAAMHGLVAKPVRNDPTIELVAKRGLEHEARFLEDLRDQGRRIVEVRIDGSRVAPLLVDGNASGAPPTPDTAAQLRAAARETLEAMRGGADVVYQGTFFDGTWRGHADFLLRRSHAPGTPDSAFGPWHYEVADTKLARHVKASAILQICSYVDLLTAIQGMEPEHLYVVLGGRGRPTDRLRVADYMAYYRRVKSEFEATVGLGPGRPVGLDKPPLPAYPPVGTYPEPVEHCEVCRWNPACRAQRRADDDLSLVAGATSRQRRALKDRGVRTRRALAGLELPVVPALEGVGTGALGRVQQQARIQVEGEDAGEMRWELLPVERDVEGRAVAGRGLLGLARPSRGDLFLDLEGDPFALDDGVEYLFGILEPGLEEEGPYASPGGVPRFHAFWSVDPAGQVTRAAEKRAFEQTVDLVMDRWAKDPGLHVYHYAAYERSALGRLAQRHATREDEVDRLLRGGVLVDLYRCVRQGIRASVESYSIKKIEPLYALRREVELKDAGSSIVAFETWLELGPDAPVADGARILAEIEGYNRDDVLSNWRLRDWLELRRADLEAREEETFERPVPDDGVAGAELTERDRHVADLVEQLTAGDLEDPVLRAANREGAGRWLLAQLLAWHRREDKSAWWRFFELVSMTDEELILEREPIGGLELVDGPWAESRSLAYRFRYPPQDHRVGADSEVVDPVTKRSAGTVLSIDEDTRTLVLKRGTSLAGDALPRSVVPRGIVPSKDLAESLLRLGEWVVRHGLANPTGLAPQEPDVAAARALILRRPPDVGQRPAAPIRAHGEDPLAAAIRVALALDGGVLPIQGPPGSGKTYAGARMIVALAQDGKRVGVVANSHKVIGNLLDEIALAAAELGVAVHIGQKPKSGESPSHAGATAYGSNAAVEAALRAGLADVVGAVAWTWARPEMARPRPVLDVLFVDEAGQMSLANVLACAPAARSIVLLGDPQQLDQPVQGHHPPGAERSALSHLLADPAYQQPDRPTVEPHEGLFLERTYRLHPDICSYTSTAFYARRLAPVTGLERQQVAARGARLHGTGLRYVGVPHTGNATDSPEEAAVVAELVRDLLDRGATWTDRDGAVRLLSADDVAIVTPYNAHVAEIRRAFDRAGLPGPFAGTVDKFQGQQRPVSIYSMATSSPEDAPRGMEFLFSLNRLNVATSRARCVAAVVASPSLVRVACRTPGQMRLANGLCLAVEAAGRAAHNDAGSAAGGAPDVLFPELV